MSKLKKRIISAVIAVCILISVFLVSGIAMEMKDGIFTNNTPTYISPNSRTNGSIRSKDDYESYIFELPNDGALSLGLEHEDFFDSSKSGWTVTLYQIVEGDERQYREVAFYESFWNEMISEWATVGLGAGTYMVMVEAGLYFLQNDFTFVSSFTETSTYEKEFNDTKETANRVEVGYGKYASSVTRSEGSDIDWFEFEIDEDSCVNLTFTHPDETFPQVGWAVTLINEKDEKVTQFTSRLTETMIRTGSLGLKAGKYFVSVEGQSSMCKDYTILVGKDKAVNFEFEMNDTPETAIPLPLGLKMSGSLADRLLGLDKDYYKFTVEANGFIDISFTHDNLNENKNGWNVRVIKAMDDGSYLEVVRKISKWNQLNLAIENLGVSPGDYYILIDGDSVSYNSETYTLSWQFTEEPLFENEPNGSLEDAQDITLDTYYQGAIVSSDVDYDEDFYKFELSKKTSVSVDFRHESGDSDDVCWYISILNERGEEVVFNGSKLSSEITLTEVAELPSGTYYVKIETGMYGSEIPYHFRLVG